MRRRLLILLLAGLAVACGDDPLDVDDSGFLPADPELLPADSPENVAHNLLASLEERWVATYDSMLTRDYEFFFNPDDAANDSLDIPISWGILDEMRAITGLFESPEVEEIKFDWSPGPVDTAEVEGSDATMAPFNVFIEITTRLPNGEPLFIQVEGAFKLHFREMSWNTESGKRAWKVTQWDDLTIRYLTGSDLGTSVAVEGATWGRIKAAFLRKGTGDRR